VKQGQDTKLIVERKGSSYVKNLMFIWTVYLRTTQRPVETFIVHPGQQ